MAMIVVVAATHFQLMLVHFCFVFSTLDSMLLNVDLCCLMSVRTSL